MKKLVIGLVAAAGIALATPALAQGVYFGAGPGGFGVGVGPGPGYGVGPGPGYYDDDDYGPRYRSYDYDRPRYRSYVYDRPRYRAYRSYNRSYAYGGCRTVIIQRGDGSVRRIRRCG